MTLNNRIQHDAALCSPTKCYPLIAAQPGIWVADHLSPFANAYAVAHAINLPAGLDLPCLQQAIQQGLLEADTLHFTFSEIDGEPVQQPVAPQAMTIEIIDLSEQTAPRAAARRIMDEDLSQAARFTQAKQTYRQLLFVVDNKRCIWYQRFHHLLVDGFSFVALTRRIADIYRQLRQGTDLSPTPFTPFSEVVEEYLTYQQSPSYQRDAAYWQQKVTNLPPPLSLADKAISGAIPSPEVLRTELFLSADSLGALTEHLQQQQLTAVDGAVALVATWLAQLTGQQAFSAGFIFMRRLGSAALSALGPVINVLPMSVDYQPQQTFADFANILATEVRKNRRHQRYDAEQISRDLGRVGDSQPLFGPVLNVKLFDYQLAFDGQSVTTDHLASGPVRDLEIAVIPSDDGALRIEFLANRQRYSAEQLETHLQRLPLIIEQLTADPTLPLGNLSLLLREERQQLQQVNATEVRCPSATLWSLIEEQGQKTPAAIALADSEQQLSYQQMLLQVAALAEQLHQQGVMPGDIVAVALPRSIFLSLALQAIVRVGAIWLPLDTGYPDDRLTIMLEDAHPRLLITTSDLKDRLQRISATRHYLYQQLLDDVPQLELPCPLPSDGAYLIYTSGSTGRPKGVLVGHQAIVNRLLWMQDHYQIGRQDIVLQKTPSSFDVSVWEFFWPLITGAQLFMAPPDAHRDPQWLLAIMLEQRVSVTHFVPSMLSAFVDSLDNDAALALQHRLRLVFCSGEALPTALARHWEKLTAIALHNLYGPTEAAVDVSWYPAFGTDLARVTGNSVPIGWPVWNTQLHILDNQLQPVPPGVTGELWLAGVQLAEGYLGRPELTAERFISAPWDATQRLYRSGDLARRLAAGEIEYLGRNDDQLKLRGQRIELSEIDAVLLRCPAVKQAASVAVSLSADSGGFIDSRQLITYVVLQEPCSCDALRITVSEQLPAHMVPVMIIALDQLPLSSNGKLDRKALPTPQLTKEDTYRAPAPGVETALATLFAELLKQPQVGATDDFFALGGHSLSAMRLAAQVRQQLHYPLNVGQVMVASTVAELAKIISGEDEGQNSGFETLLPLRQGDGPRLFCFHPASGFAWQFSVLQRYLHQDWAIIGIQSPNQQGALSQGQHLDDVCERHLQTVIDLQPQGPYYFIGYSLGGTLAQGIASRLEARGEKVAFLGLLDTWPPETQNWDEKQGKNVLDPQVLAEVNLEREQFVASQRQQAGPGMEHLFAEVEANYGHSVRLLTTAHSAITHGQATLFSAQQTQQPGMDAATAWSPFIQQLDIFPVDCRHVDIISSAVFKLIGPEINRRLTALLA